MDSVKLGVVSVYWPPHFGGAEKYVHAMVDGLVKRGVDAWGITATPVREDRDNGIENVHRIGEEVHPTDKVATKGWFKEVVNHVRENDYTHILINSPLTRVIYGFTEDLFYHLRNVCPHLKIGVIHHDIGLRNRGFLEQMYVRWGVWEKAAEEYVHEQRLYFNNESIIFNKKDAYWAFDSPLFFEPDFVLGNTEWSCRFIDPLNTIPHYILHPILEELNSPKSEKLEKVNITMLNPLFHKGRSYMADFINDYNHKWTYRVLLGSYGGQKQDFLRMIKDSWAVRDGRVDIVKYVQNIEDAYDATDIFIYPSRYEGYGMAAVEPMFRGVPVLVQDYPAIREAVGDAALILPYGTDSGQWIEEVEELLLDDEKYEEIKEKGLEHTKTLLLRQDEEIGGLIRFLEEL